MWSRPSSLSSCRLLSRWTPAKWCCRSVQTASSSAPKTAPLSGPQYLQVDRTLGEDDIRHAIAYQEYLNRGVDEKAHPNWQEDLMSLGSTDNHYEADRIPVGTDKIRRRNYTYIAIGGGRFTYGVFVRSMVMGMVAQMSASADVLALASVEISLSAIAPGQCSTFKWRGKPVMIRHRTEGEIEEARSTPMEELKDPQRDEDRASNPKYLVVIGVCTHLGCVPIPNAGSYKGWFCPCHGSHYDLSGRIRKGPAPLNLEIPEYRYISDDTIVVG